MLAHIIDLFVPRHCLMCHRELAHDEEVLCLQCLSQAPIITSQDFTNGEMCRLFWHLLPVERAAAMFRYRPSSPWRALVTAGKFGNRHDTLLGLGHLMGQHFMRQGFFDEIDAILPMPITPQRQHDRGYNQSLLLAQGISHITGIPVLDDVVKRQQDDSPQTHRNKWERRLALQGHFTLLHPDRIVGKHILLLDDVCTTGASMVALGETLRSAADVRLSILTLMRTSIA